MRNVVIVSAVRTPVGRALKGTLKDIRPDDLAALVIKEAVARAKIDPAKIDDLILGCAMPEAEQGMNVARLALFRAGLPKEISAMTINRFCSSGLEAIALAADKIRGGTCDCVLAGGVESMSFVPMGGNKFSPNLALAQNYPEAYITMGITAENVATQYGISRLEQDTFAYNSHMKAKAALEQNLFAEQIVPVKGILKLESQNGKAQEKEVMLDRDECVRAETTVEALGQLKPAFKLDGSVTAGNASPLNDGAAALLIMAEEMAKDLQLPILAYFRGYQTAGLAPEIMGVGPIYAIPKVLKKLNLNLTDIDLIELNEAFAAQSLAIVKELQLDPTRVNVNGGAIALGHPLGCTGAKLSVQIIHELRRQQKRYGLVSMCIGGGMGAAGIFERA
jgi:acetyl-CoA acyltransferase